MEGFFLSIFTNIYEQAQSAARYLQKQLLTRLWSNLGYTVYTHQHIPVMIIPVCMIKHYLGFNRETELAKAAKTNGNQAEAFPCLSILMHCILLTCWYAFFFVNGTWFGMCQHKLSARAETTSWLISWFILYQLTDNYFDNWLIVSVIFQNAKKNLLLSTSQLSQLGAFLCYVC